MELYILRHGVAEESSASGRDEDRQLTPEGRRKLREILRTAARAGLQPSLILSSPYVRAMQTAQTAAELLGYSGDILKVPALLPEGRPDDVWQEIRTHRDERQVVLASHNPLCATLAGYLLGSPQLYVDFKKGAILRVDFDGFGSAPRGVLRWMLVPKLAA